MANYKLRDYQYEGLCSMVEAAKRAREAEAAAPADRVLCILPTGAGKTLMMLAFARLIKKHWGWRTLITVPYKKLIYQTAKQVREKMPEMSVSLVGDGHFSLEGDVVVAVQASLAGDRLRRIPSDMFQLVVFDEAHHAPAESYKTCLDYFSKARLIVGMTATYIRGDDVSVASDQFFPNVIVWNTVRQLTTAGYLVEAFGYYKHTGISLEEVKVRGGNFVERQLSHAVNTRERNNLAVDAWFEYMEGLPTIVYCVDIPHAKAMAECFQERGVPAAAVWGVMSDDEYDRVMEDYLAGRTLVLANAKLLTEGWDAPLTSGILLAKPTTKTAANVLVPQMIGRALRPHEESGKSQAVVVELRDLPRKRSGEEENLAVSGLASFVGSPESEFVCGRVALHKQASRNSALQAWKERRKLLEDLQSPEMVMEKFDVIERLASVSVYAWVPLGSTLYMPLDADDFIEIAQETPSSFEVRVCINGELSVEKAAGSRDRALEIADQWVTRHVHDKRLILSNAEWRAKEATENQVKYAQSLTKLDLSLLRSLTCGQVSDLIRSARALMVDPSPDHPELRLSGARPDAPATFTPHVWQLGSTA